MNVSLYSCIKKRLLVDYTAFLNVLFLLRHCVEEISLDVSRIGVNLNLSSCNMTV